MDRGRERGCRRGNTERLIVDVVVSMLSRRMLLMLRMRVRSMLMLILRMVVRMKVRSLMLILRLSIQTLIAD